MEELLKSLHLLEPGGRSTESQLRNLCDYGSLEIFKVLIQEGCCSVPSFLLAEQALFPLPLLKRYNHLGDPLLLYSTSSDLSPNPTPNLFLMYTIFGIWSKNAEQRGLITSLSMLALLLLILPRLLSNLPCCQVRRWLTSSLLSPRVPRFFLQSCFPGVIPS